jgi:hypothetical protein
VIVQKSLAKVKGDSVAFVSSRSNRKWSLRVKDVPGFSIRFISRKGTCGRGFELTIIIMLSSRSCFHPKSISNGKVEFVNFGKTALYSCCNGYKLVGAKKRSCVDGQWSPSSIPLCTRVDVCTPPEHMTIKGSLSIALGSTAELSCTYGYKLSDATTLPFLCDCNGIWNITLDPPPCQRFHCGPPPPPPKSGGLLAKNSTKTGIFTVGSVVNYTCPSGYGLDGIPYRVCSDSLTWEPNSRFNTCKENYTTCPSPEIPKNGIMRAFSFGENHMISFGCQRGYDLEGSSERVCDVTSSNEPFWTGVPPTCKSLFKSPEVLAVQLKETFVDRAVSCPENNNIAVDVTPTPTPGINNQLEDTTKEDRTVGCRGRAVVVGEGCIDLIYVIDCSKSVGKENFQDSLDFAGRSSSMFNIDGDKARVSLVTYDHEVYELLPLKENRTGEETTAAIANASFCAGNTATRKVLKFIRLEVLPKSRPECKRAIFLFSDGDNNWAGDPKSEADGLKAEKNVEIYTIAFGVAEIKVDVSALQSLASKPSFFFHVKDAQDMRRAFDKTFLIDVDYCEHCGIPLVPECNRDENGECDSKSGAWPWMVAIYRLENNGNTVFHCGGTIIGDCWVLTAAHCLKGYHPDDLLVVVGDTERYVRQFTEKTYTVERSFIHPTYEQGGDYNRDIGLLKLPCNISCSPFIRKGCLPTTRDEIFYTPGTNCIVAGWGATEKREHGGRTSAKSTAMKELHLPIADHERCKNSTSDRYKEDVTEFTVCAGDGTGQNDACDGDSGGPLFCKRPNEEKYVVVGIVSWGEGCGQAGKYGIFTHLLKLVGWVHEQMDLYDCEPPRDPDEEDKDSCPVPPKELV